MLPLDSVLEVSQLSLLGLVYRDLVVEFVLQSWFKGSFRPTVVTGFW